MVNYGNRLCQNFIGSVDRRDLQSKQVKRSSHEWINKFIIANLISVIINNYWMRFL